MLKYIVLVAFLQLLVKVKSCTNLLVTKGAAADGMNHISYNADDAALMGAVTRYEAGKHKKDDMRQVYSWDYGNYLGQIPQAEETYNVIGNANEYGVVIGETTHGGLKILSNVGKTEKNGTIIDYGSAIYITLQRARTAREAIEIMTSLLTEYGYASDMEGFSIGDPEELWYMELLGRGNLGKGILYVALRIPDGHILAHANQARIRDEFWPCDNPEWCRMSPDLVDFAIKNGFYDPELDGPKLSFSDTFDPISFEGARFCEARVWYAFLTLADPDAFDAEYYAPYAQGLDLTRRMPLWLPSKKSRITRSQMHQVQSSHYENSFLDPRIDVGAGPDHTPYRYNGLTWIYQNITYVNERIIGEQYTGWHFVADLRADLPDTARGLRATLWWGPDDHSFAPHVPIHGGANRIHTSYDDKDCIGRSSCREEANLPGTITNFSLDNMWWVCNLVADQVYNRYAWTRDIVLRERDALEAELRATTQVIEHEALRLAYSGIDPTGLISQHAFSATESTHKAWLHLWQRLVVTFIDGRITAADPSNKVCGCDKQTPTYDDNWKAKVIADTGNKYKEPGTPDPSVPDLFDATARLDASTHPSRLRSTPIKQSRLPRHATKHKLDIKGVAGASRQRPSSSLF
uniref:Dipeptidase n=1 Tax=Aureoumbra lagunensis TaxID=44058 RepID=A0A7S3JY54_9STRA|mmetsp:Transcript_16343/g.19872  ORF Transcript_16343/g.19872 Transcript_16343/m.19872 type:complete len:633 (+) Transcript_16343:134-2032(+)